MYIASDPSRVKNIRGAVFSEMVGWGDEWFLKGTRTGNSYMDLLAAECRRQFPNLKHSEFISLYGNDEYIFDSVQVGIPSLSLQKFPFAEYHTSNDSPSGIQDEDLVRAYEIILHMVEVIERDEIYEFVHPVPFYMSRYDLYADAVYDKDAHCRNREIQLRLDGKASLLKIANDLGLSFDIVREVVERMRALDLVRPASSSIWDKIA